MVYSYASANVVDGVVTFETAYLAGEFSEPDATSYIVELIADVRDLRKANTILTTSGARQPRSQTGAILRLLSRRAGTPHASAYIRIHALTRTCFLPSLSSYVTRDSLGIPLFRLFLLTPSFVHEQPDTDLVIRKLDPPTLPDHPTDSPRVVVLVRNQERRMR